MPTQLNRCAYQRLVDDDIAWLRQQPTTLERNHIECVLRESVDGIYGPGDDPRDAMWAGYRGKAQEQIPVRSTPADHLWLFRRVGEIGERLSQLRATVEESVMRRLDQLERTVSSLRG